MFSSLKKNTCLSCHVHRNRLSWTSGHPSLHVTEPCGDGAGYTRRPVTCRLGLALWAGSSNRGDPGSIPGWGSSPGEGNGGSGQTPSYITALPPSPWETLCFWHPGGLLGPGGDPLSCLDGAGQAWGWHCSELGGKPGGVLCPQNEVVQGAGHVELSACRELSQPKPCMSVERDSHAISQKGDATRRGKMYPFWDSPGRDVREKANFQRHSADAWWKESATVTCTPVFIAALFTTARTWKQPRCPSADKWIRKLWYIYTMEYYSAIKKNTFESVLMRWTKLKSFIQNEVSQKDKQQYSILTHICGI